jgi:diamine N-acetyltransferase
MIDQRYQRQGIGRQAMRCLMDHFIGSSYATILLSFRPENLAARQLYLSLGFVEHVIEPDGEVVYRLGPPPE